MLLLEVVVVCVDVAVASLLLLLVMMAMMGTRHVIFSCRRSLSTISS